MDPTTPTVYRAALDKMAGLKKNSGLNVAAWQPLNAWAAKLSPLQLGNNTASSQAKTDVFASSFQVGYRWPPSSFRCCPLNQYQEPPL